MVVTKRGKSVPLELTRRRFLCALFSFLTAQSLLITCLGIFSSAMSAWVLGQVPHEILQIVRGAGTLIFLFALTQLLSVTCLGLYYLGDRIHIPD